MTYFYFLDISAFIFSFAIITFTLIVNSPRNTVMIVNNKIFKL